MRIELFKAVQECEVRIGGRNRWSKEFRAQVLGNAEAIFKALFDRLKEESRERLEDVVEYYQDTDVAFRVFWKLVPLNE